MNQMSLIMREIYFFGPLSVMISSRKHWRIFTAVKWLTVPLFNKSEVNNGAFFFQMFKKRAKRSVAVISHKYYASKYFFSRAVTHFCVNRDEISFIYSTCLCINAGKLSRLEKTALILYFLLLICFEVFLRSFYCNHIHTTTDIHTHHTYIFKHTYI